MSCQVPTGWDALNPVNWANYTACVAQKNLLPLGNKTITGVLDQGGKAVHSVETDFGLVLHSTEQEFNSTVSTITKPLRYAYQLGDAFVDSFRTGKNLLDTGTKTLNDTRELIKTFTNWLQSGGLQLPSFPGGSQIGTDFSTVNSSLDDLASRLQGLGAGSTSSQTAGFDIGTFLIGPFLLIGGIAAVVLLVAYLLLRKKKK